MELSTDDQAGDLGTSKPNITAQRTSKIRGNFESLYPEIVSCRTISKRQQCTNLRMRTVRSVSGFKGLKLVIQLWSHPCPASNAVTGHRSSVGDAAVPHLRPPRRDDTHDLIGFW